MKVPLLVGIILLPALAFCQQAEKQASPTKISPDAAQRLLCGSSDSLAPESKPSSNATRKNSLCGAAVRPPLYPPEAKRQGVEGAVLLKALIGKDGSVKDLSVIEGHPLLVPAAIDAVRRWKYKPYYVKGEPVDVETTITVNFRLEKRAAPHT